MTALALPRRVMPALALGPSIGFIGGLQVTTGAVLAAAPFLGVAWAWWLLAFAMYFVHSCVGLSVGYHRYYAHHSFVAPRWAEILFILAGALGGVGSPAAWAAMHRSHHRHSDTGVDPHSPRNHGLAMILIRNYAPGAPSWAMRRALARDRLQLFVHRHYVPFVLGYAAALAGLDWRLFVFAWAAPVAATLWLSGITIYVTHHPKFGYRNHETADNSRNVWWISLLAWGEGWHNNHHADPRRLEFGGKWWEVDVGARCAHVLSKSERDKSYS